MSSELTTTEALEGEYIAAGDAEHTFDAQDPISDSMRDAIARQQQAFSAQSAQQNQMDALRQQQYAFGQAAGLGGFSGSGGLGGIDSGLRLFR
jgi:hypothetical protein